MEDVIYWLKYKISLKGRRKGMKRKVVLRLLSLVMVASMTGTMLPSNIQTASAEEVDVTEKTAALEDGINDAWTQSLWKMAGCILNQLRAIGIIPEQDRRWL